MTRYLKHIVIVLLLVSNGLLSAQKLSDTIHLERVNITASKPLQESGLVLTKIDTLTLRKTITASLSHLLADHTPVFIKSYGPGSLASASFRGTAASHTQVFWNGMNINSPMVGQVDFSLIPVYFVDDVSIYHGGSSLHQGSGALGGSVHFRSQPTWNSKPEVSLVQGIGSFDTYQSYVSVKGGSKKVHAGIRAFHQQSQNNFTYFNDANGLWNMARQENAEFDKYGTLADFYLKANESNILSLHGWLHLSNRNLPPIMSYQGNGRDENQQDEQLRIAARWKNYGKRYKTEITSGISSESLEYYQAYQTPLGMLVNYDSHSRHTSYHNKATTEYFRTENTTIKGVLNFNHHSARIQNLEQTGYDVTRNEAGASVNVHHKLTDRFTAYGLLRQEWIDGRFSPVMPSVGFDMLLAEKQPLRLTANITRNYHQPTLNDLYWIPGGNPELEPEEGYTADAAMNYKWTNADQVKIQTRLTAFGSLINDWILWQPGEFRYWMANNVKKVYSRGLEYALKASWITNKLTLQVNSNYSYTRTTNIESYHPADNSVGKQLIYIPEHKANGMLQAKTDLIYLSYHTSFTGQRHTTTDNSYNTLPAFTLHHATVGKTIGIGDVETEWQLKVNNIFNKDYQAVLWRAMPGRHYMFLLKVNL